MIAPASVVVSNSNRLTHRLKRLHPSHKIAGFIKRITKYLTNSIIIRLGRVQHHRPRIGIAGSQKIERPARRLFEHLSKTRRADVPMPLEVPNSLPFVFFVRPMIWKIRLIPRKDRLSFLNINHNAPLLSVHHILIFDVFCRFSCIQFYLIYNISFRKPNEQRPMSNLHDAQRDYRNKMQVHIS